MIWGFGGNGLGAEVVGGGAGAFAEEEVTADEVGEDGTGAVGTEAGELGELRGQEGELLCARRAGCPSPQ